MLTNRQSRISKGSILNNSSLPPPPLGNYRIYILNFFAPQLENIEREFVNQLAIQSRSHVGGVSVGKIISKHELGSDIGTTVKIDLHTVDEEVYNEIILESSEGIHKSKNYLDELLVWQSKQVFDLLEFWEKTKVPGKGGGTTRRSAKGKANNPRCTLGQPQIVGLASKESSKVLKVKIDADKQFKVDHPEDGVDMFILLVGNFSKQFVLDLIKAQYPIGGMTFFVPATMIYKFKAGLLPQMVDFYDLMKTDKTKNFSFDVEFLPILSPCQAKYFGKQIDDELTGHVYDLEIIRVRNYEDFLRRYVQNDATMKGACSRHPTNATHRHTFCEFKEVFIFYEDLLSKIDPSAPMEPIQNISSYFIDNEFECVVFEDNNTLLKTEVRMNALSHSFTRIFRFLRDKLIDILYDLEDIEDPIHFQNTEETRLFLEPLTNLTLCQRFFDLYHECKTCQKYKYDDWIVVVFERPTIFKENVTKQNLMTRLCFRDFVHYVFSKKPVLGQLEPADEIAEQIDQNADQQLRKNLPASEFVRLRSLKYLQGLEQFDEKYTATNNVQRTMTDVSLDPMPQPIYGYDLGDTYMEVTSDDRVFR